MKGWFSLATRRARWMDLLGDYAGAELFLISGESLLERVLDDPLLAIGRDEDAGFQLMHAYYILETTLLEFLDRRANFEIVFWQVNYHSTIHSGGSSFNVASRNLARSLLFEHLLNLDVAVHTFRDLNDPSWLTFKTERRPMFVMVNDGHVSDTCGFHDERALLQRSFLFQLVSGGMAIALLNGAEFRDSKIMSFVYHEAHQRSRYALPQIISAAVNRAKLSLDEEVAKHNPGQPFSLPSIDQRFKPPRSRMVEFSQRVVQHMRFEFAQELLFIFILHAAILPELSLAERAQSHQLLPRPLMDLLFKSFLPRVFLIASALPFDVDGRVFVSLISIIITHSNGLPDIIGRAAYEEALAVWSPLSLPIPNFTAFRARHPSVPANTALGGTNARRTYKLLPFHHSVFDFTSILSVDSLVEEEGPASAAHLDFGIPFSDTKHWHNSSSILPSHLGGEDHTTLDERQRLRQNRNNQRFMSTLQKNAATLTGALGTSLQQIVIVPVKMASKNSKAPKERPAQNRQSGRKGKPALTSAQQLLEKIKQEKAASQDDLSFKWWQKELDGMARLTTDAKVEKLQSMFRNKRSDEPMIGLEMRLYSINLTLLQWIESSDQESPSVRDKFTLAILKEVKALCEHQKLTSSAANIIKAVLASLGFAAYSSSLVSESVQLPDRDLSFTFQKLFSRSTKKPQYPFMKTSEDPVDWQLRLFGDFMNRSMDGARDPRVAFTPDAWQRDVLDCIDQNFSVLVIAPTSAGKTFISYYSMEKILRDSDDGILVYVAPTKALVTQIAAEIYARFKKNLSSKSLWAIHTRDYRVNDPLKCQILVTVPEILATLLLSPPLARVWTPKLKSIILDEIHSIGQQEGGSVWEQIILMAPCPIIGLSATVGSPQDFSQWLESVQTAHGFKYRVIEHPHRYSHLRKFAYIMDEEASTEFRGLDRHEDTKRTRFLHPISLMPIGIRSIPDDLALEAADTLTLFRALKEHAPIASCEPLDPRTFFSSEPGDTLLVQKDIIRYERALKEKLVSFMKGPDNPVASNIILSLQDPKIGSLHDPNKAPSRDDYKNNLIYLLSDLHVKGELPAILFSFDRTNCDILAQKLLSTLETAESNWRNRSVEWKTKIQQWERWKLTQAKLREKATAKASKQRKRNEDDEPESREDHQNWESLFDPHEPSPPFSFAGMTTYSKSELAEQILELRRWSSTPGWALDALERGVGIHHAGMNKKYRSLVESLFRQGFVRVMIATGTLALGINAPAKTAVFCGDSPFLTALMYRQCAGRAGRRGFDLRGNVIFYGLPMERVQRLVTSRLPPLGSSFPLTSTLSLRLMNLLKGSNDAEAAVAAVASILSLPRISFVSEIGRAQMLNHMRFSIEYLRRSGLIDKEGNPMNLFSLAAHLYYHEPSNFALIALLKSGALHDICEQSSMVAKREFILIMAHLFGRRYISRVYASEANLAIARKSPSMVVLPDLPESVREVFESHNQQIIRTFSGYALACAAQLEMKSDVDHNCLPLSKISYPGSPQADPCILRSRLRETAIHVVARSLFAANSGHTDEFTSVEELSRSARNGLYLNNNAIPSLKPLTTRDGEHVLNAYLLDFFIHGQVSTLANANGIRRGDVWYLLQDFSLTLATIVNSLKQLFLSVPEDAEAGEGHDPAEREDDEEMENGFERPPGVKDRDWRLYSIAYEAQRDFDEKFKAMWA
ncbi:hypothetical protein C8F04DRAFT_1343667 [Mycena alexandri]|uniref:P-loop containing nucleoside triphosphate hydrolase protein n=1 Tax=Mycena alexandri TaxID=1745969 RepID=A0AAD6TFJ9_9AGAR|nr:hypothetical protein C8F04DRAFT_1343667 [Mycena alexandri]